MNIDSLVYGLFALLFISCHANNLTSIKEFNEQGTLYKSYSIDRDSLIQGAYIVYYEDGSTAFERSNYVNSKLEGSRTLFYDSGKPEIIEQYHNDVLSDTLKVFYPSGHVKRLEYYKKGAITGVLKSFYETGNIKEEVTYSNNIENGLFKEYYSNGNLKWQGYFLDGDNEIGELLQYDSSGVLVKKMLCDSLSICRTLWTISDGDMTLDKVANVN